MLYIYTALNGIWKCQVYIPFRQNKERQKKMEFNLHQQNSWYLCTVGQDMFFRNISVKYCFQRTSDWFVWDKQSLYFGCFEKCSFFLKIYNNRSHWAQSKHPIHYWILRYVTYYLCCCFSRWGPDRNIESFCFISNPHWVFKHLLIPLSATRRWRSFPPVPLCNSRGSVKHQRAGCLLLRADSQGQLGLVGAISSLSSRKHLQSHQSQSSGGSSS